VTYISACRLLPRQRGVPLRDGEIVAAAQEERFTRKRHDAAFPDKAIEFCLREAGITTKQRYDHVCFYDKPVRKFARIIESHVALAPRGLRTFLMAMPVWLREKMWTAREVEERSKVIQARCSSRSITRRTRRARSIRRRSIRPPWLTLDGVGEWATASAGVGKGSVLELHREIHYPHSLGLLYSAFTYHAGFTVNSGEYKLTGARAVWQAALPRRDLEGARRLEERRLVPIEPRLLRLRRWPSHDEIEISIGSSKDRRRKPRASSRIARWILAARCRP